MNNMNYMGSYSLGLRGRVPLPFLDSENWIIPWLYIHLHIPSSSCTQPLLTIDS